MAALYTWDTYPASGTEDFETEARSVLNEWKSNAALLDAQAQDYSPAVTTNDIIALAIALSSPTM